ncbi:MAG: hypothetical protein ACYC4L_14655 [Chloroflexota bacterium]
MGVARLSEVGLLFWLLLSALAYSTSAFMVVGLLAGYYRTATNRDCRYPVLLQ